jgi:hypothetical protein
MASLEDLSLIMLLTRQIVYLRKLAGFDPE